MVVGLTVAKVALKTQVDKKAGGTLKDKNLGDEVWVPEEKTGLLVKVTIVHELHVPGKYSEGIKKYESKSDNIVWAKQDLGNAHFRWFALYADALVDEAIDKVVEEDKYFNHFDKRTLYKEQDETTRDY